MQSLLILEHHCPSTTEYVLAAHAYLSE